VLHASPLFYLFLVALLVLTICFIIITQVRRCRSWHILIVIWLLLIDYTDCMSYCRCYLYAAHGMMHPTSRAGSKNKFILWFIDDFNKWISIQWKWRQQFNFIYEAVRSVPVRCYSANRCTTLAVFLIGTNQSINQSINPPKRHLNSSLRFLCLTKTWTGSSIYACNLVAWLVSRAPILSPPIHR